MKLIKSYLIGIFSYIILIFFLLSLISLIFAYTKIEDRYIDSFVFASLAFSAFISSFLVCKQIKKRGLLHGVLINIIGVLIIFVISSILNGKIIFTNTLGIYLAICVLTGIVGGILGVNV